MATNNKQPMDTVMKAPISCDVLSQTFDTSILYEAVKNPEGINRDEWAAHKGEFEKNEAKKDKTKKRNIPTLFIISLFHYSCTSFTHFLIPSYGSVQRCSDGMGIC